MPTIDQEMLTAIEHHQAGRFAMAERIYRQVLAQNPRHADAMHLLGVLAYQSGRHQIAAQLIEHAISINPNEAVYHSNLGAAWQSLRQLDRAIAAYRQALELQPDYAEAHFNLGVALQEAGKLEEAIAAYRRALQLKSDYAAAASNLGVALKDSGRLPNAVAALQQAVQIKPDFAEAYSNLGYVLRLSGQLEQSIAACRRAIQLQPGFAQAHNNLGITLRDSDRLEEAIAAHRQAIQIDPNLVEAYFNLGLALRERMQLELAISAFGRALELKPDLAEARVNLGYALRSMGKVPEAIACYRQALEMQPDSPKWHDSLLYAMHFVPTYEPRTIFAEHQEWARRHADPLRFQIKPHERKGDPERRLRIGYISPDFREHPVAGYLDPILEAHDRSAFQVYCYCDVRKPDAVTEQLRSRLDARSDVWRNVFGKTDDLLAKQIREDQIDILIDLTGHTGDNRMLVFARKPAPVQVTHFGYPDTTGLSTVDYRITDAYSDPPGASEQYYTEKLVRLPYVAWCYRPMGESPAVGALPCESSGRGMITFGSLNDFAKVTPQILRVWGQILAAVPDSKLVLQSMASSEAVRRAKEIFGEVGVDAGRVSVRHRLSRQEYLELHNSIDIALDPFPYNGGVTTCDALWMGVPVVALAGNSYASRQGVSILNNLNLLELIAATVEDYQKIAIELAGDRKRLAALRAGLRERLRQSAIMKFGEFTRELEATYRQMWRTWCAAGPGSSDRS